MAQSDGDEKLREKVQDICDRVGVGLLPPTGAGAIMQLILADRKQHELEARIETAKKIDGMLPAEEPTIIASNRGEDQDNFWTKGQMALAEMLSEDIYSYIAELKQQRDQLGCE